MWSDCPNGKDCSPRAVQASYVGVNCVSPAIVHSMLDTVLPIVTAGGAPYTAAEEAEAVSEAVSEGQPRLRFALFCLHGNWLWLHPPVRQSLFPFPVLAQKAQHGVP